MEVNNKISKRKKHIRIIYAPMNITKRVDSIKEASVITGISIYKINQILNWDNRSINGYKFYDWG